MPDMEWGSSWFRSAAHIPRTPRKGKPSPDRNRTAKTASTAGGGKERNGSTGARVARMAAMLTAPLILVTTLIMLTAVATVSDSIIPADGRLIRYDPRQLKGVEWRRASEERVIGASPIGKPRNVPARRGDGFEENRLKLGYS